MKTTSHLLIDESPLQVLPSLAVKIGLNEAIILQQLHYWLNNKSNPGIVEDGYKWVYNSYLDWKGNFPFWSTHTIQRTILGMEKQGLVVSRQFESHKWNQRKAYRIDYDKLDELSTPIGQDEECQKGMPDSANLAHSLISNTETTTETTIDLNTASSPTDSTLAFSPEGDSLDLILQEPTVEESQEPEVQETVIFQSQEESLIDNGYPSEVSAFVAAFCDCWRITPPPRRSRQGAYWLRSARELAEACGVQGAQAVRDYYNSYRRLARPFTVATPASIVNMVRVFVGERGKVAVEVPGLWVGG
jgi:hypothetical protein